MLRCGARKAPRIGQGLDRACARVMQRAMRPVAAGAMARLRGIQQRDRCAKRLLLFKSCLQVLETACRMGAMQGAFAHRLAGDVMGFDQVEHLCRRRREGCVQPHPLALPQRIANRLWRQPEPRVHQPDIATGTAMADCFSLQQQDRRALSGCCQGCGTAGEAAPQNAKVNGGFPCEYIRFKGFLRAVAPQIPISVHGALRLPRIVQQVTARLPMAKRAVPFRRPSDPIRRRPASPSVRVPGSGHARHARPHRCSPSRG